MTNHNLEVELAAIKPREPSPALRQRIADDLQTTPQQRPGRAPTAAIAPQRSARRFAAGLAAIATLAACMLAALLLRQTNRTTIPQPPVEVPHPLIAVAFDDALPAMWTYQRALARSANEAEALLDKHASSVPTAIEFAPTRLFIRSDRNLLLQGDL